MSSSPLSVRLEAIRDAVAVVRTPDGQAWTLPLSAIYGTPTVGQELRLLAVAPGATDLGETALAAAIVNELLHPST